MSVRFHETRRWRFDWAWVAQKVALEVDGGVYIQGRHTRASGWLKDSEKLNTAASMGWRLLRATPQQVASGAIIETVREALK
jgi:very-short-patch-repair endonuclease